MSFSNPVPMKEPAKSNPSKRHRERLNAILDEIASLLPFEQSVISRLDRLSILRLSGSFLRTKSHFQAALHNEPYAPHHPHIPGHLYSDPGFTDTDSVLQALSGFLFIVTADGEVFYASRTVEQYLGFHQSDIIHQSALELIHSEDREEFKKQLNWRQNFAADTSLHHALNTENAFQLQRSFTCRFRCLLDNTSGFITLEISGRLKLLHGQTLRLESNTSASVAQQEPQLALFALCCPFGPLPLLDVSPREYTFRSKHKMDMTLLSMDQKGRMIFAWSDRELSEKGGYDLVHPDDLQYFSQGHHELIKTGCCGLIAYRLMTRDFRWIWLQTSAKVTYKNTKIDYVICTHRHLTNDEGEELMRKRGNEFKLPYPMLDDDASSGNYGRLDEDCRQSRKKKPAKMPYKEYLQSGRKRKNSAIYRPDSAQPLAGYKYHSLDRFTPTLKQEYPQASTYPAANNHLANTEGLAELSISTISTSAQPVLYPSPFNYYCDPLLPERNYQHTLQYYSSWDVAPKVEKNFDAFSTNPLHIDVHRMPFDLGDSSFGYYANESPYGRPSNGVDMEKSSTIAYRPLLCTDSSQLHQYCANLHPTAPDDFAAAGSEILSAATSNSSRYERNSECRSTAAVSVIQRAVKSSHFPPEEKSVKKQSNDADSHDLEYKLQAGKEVAAISALGSISEATNALLSSTQCS